VVQGCQPAQHWFKILEKNSFMAKDKEKGPSREQMGNCPQTPKGAFALSAAVATVLPPRRQFGSCCRSAVITALLSLFAAVATVLPPTRLSQDYFGSCCRSAVITALHLCVVFSFNFQSQAVGCDVRT
jgi:hypothetical protein